MQETPYTDLYSTLNAHLFDTYTPLSSECTVHSAPREALSVIPEIQARLRKTFRWNKILFERPHTVLFPNPSYTQPTFQVGRKIMDVNYMWCTEYFHFFTEVLPNVLYLNSVFPGIPIHCRVSPFTAPMFRWFGIQNDVVPDVSSALVSRVRATFAECGNISPKRLAWIRDVVAKKLTFTKTHGILIRRHGTRELLNEPEVLECLKTRFPQLEWVIFDALSVAETATLFSKAAVIVAPHGAGLTNMLFSSSGTLIVECMPIEMPNICYWHTSQMLGNPYAMVPCHVSDHTCKMRVDVSDLIRAVEQCGLSSTPAKSA